MTDGYPKKRVPPPEHQFKPGQSGNPKGRPKGSGKKKPAEHFYDQSFVISTANGKKRRLTRGEHLVEHAIQVSLGKRDLELGQLLVSLKTVTDQAKERYSNEIKRIRGFAWEPSNEVICLDDVLRHLDIVEVLYRFTKKARMRLNPWAASIALEHLDGRLTREEQQIVFEAIRRPREVKFPPWWAADLRGRKGDGCGALEYGTGVAGEVGDSDQVSFEARDVEPSPQGVCSVRETTPCIEENCRRRTRNERFQVPSWRS